jgi:hypothetical protein
VCTETVVNVDRHRYSTLEGAAYESFGQAWMPGDRYEVGGWVRWPGVYGDEGTSR